MHKRLLSVGVACLLASCSLAQEGTPVAIAKAPTRIHVIGASVSGGFEDGPLTGAPEQEDSIALPAVLKKWADGEVRVSSHSTLKMCLMFQDPLRNGEQMVARAKKKKADVIVAADFLFWFAYGYVRGDQRKARSARFERGLELLASFDVPVLVGDLPDMTGAAPRLLKPSMVPSVEIQKVLNARLQQWASERDNVTLVPLAKFVKQLKDEGVTLPLAAGAMKTAPCALLQGDHLHANRLGVAFLMLQLQQPLRALFPEQHALHTRKWTFDEFVEAAGAEDVLDELQAATAPAKGK